MSWGLNLILLVKSPLTLQLTPGGQEGGEQLHSHQRLGETSEELLEQTSHIVWIDVISQLHILTGVKLFPDLWRRGMNSVLVPSTHPPPTTRSATMQT